MRKVTAAAGIAALFFTAQASAVIQEYNVTFTYGGISDLTYTTAGGASPTFDPNNRYSAVDANGSNHYNADKHVPNTDYSGSGGPDCTGEVASMEYACLAAAQAFVWTAIPVTGEAGNGGANGGVAIGSLFVDTDAGTISGTLSVIPYEYRFADGSPFVVGYRATSGAATLAVNATGTFDDAGNWAIDGGGAFFFDPGLTCNAATTFGPGPTDLCLSLPTFGQDLSIGDYELTYVDDTGALTGGSETVAGLEGTTASGDAGATVSGSGEWGRGAPSGGGSQILYDIVNGNIEGGAGGTGANITAGLWTLDATFVQVVPVPAAVWLFGSALGLLGWVRRRVSV